MDIQYYKTGSAILE